MRTYEELTSQEKAIELAEQVSAIARATETRINIEVNSNSRGVTVKVLRPDGTVAFERINDD